jgi:endonuclease YncB( thermonuclease family)
MNIVKKEIIKSAALGSVIGLGGALVGAVIIMIWNKATTPESIVISPRIGTINTNNFQECDVVPNSVHDGDTIRVKCQGAQLKIRFACIDAPELAQPMGQESRDYLRSLLSESGDKVKIQPITTDRYGRTVAQLWITRSIGESLLQSEMASTGMAYPYERYSSNCPDWEAVTSAASRAQSERVGVYSQDLEKPWDYRASKR